MVMAPLRCLRIDERVAAVLQRMCDELVGHFGAGQIGATTSLAPLDLPHGLGVYKDNELQRARGPRSATSLSPTSITRH